MSTDPVPIPHGHEAANILLVDDQPARLLTYRAILEGDPNDDRAIHSLDRLFAEHRRWHDLIELLIRQLDGAAGAAWISIKLRLGGIFDYFID